MTESADATTTPVDNTADATATTEATPDQAQSDAEPTPNSEAARYRVQLREAESQRDALAERLTGYQRRECEAIVADLLELPADLWEIGQADVAAFYNEDGTVNDAELRAAAGALIETRPRLAKPQRTPTWGQHSGDTPRDNGGASWGDVINPK